MKEEITTTIKGKDICLYVANSLMRGGRFVICLLLLILSNVVEAQTTTYFYGKNPGTSSDGQYTCALYSVELQDAKTLVKLEITALRNIRHLRIRYSMNTYILVNELYKIGIKKYNNGVLYTWDIGRLDKGEKDYILLEFPERIPAGITNFTLVDDGGVDIVLEGDYGFNGILKAGGFNFRNCTINNPAIGGTSWTEASIKQHADENNDGICGIYECSEGNSYILGCVKENGVYKLIYLGRTNSILTNKYNYWKEGDIKSILRPTASYGLYKADWYMANKTMNSATIVFDGVSMKTKIDGNGENFYLKMYPIYDSGGGSGYVSSSSGKWSGTGFALTRGYIATNNHVVEGANSIKVKGIGGSFGTEYTATVVATDKNNDLAILKINDSRFNGFGSIPYSVKTSTSEVGEEVFVLGYPLTSTMGTETKLTTGVISSKSGYQGDVTLYQISAPVQPGNSGGPLFDSKGNVIGIVSAKHSGAENVGYAVKTSCLRNLIESTISTNVLPTNNTLTGMPLTSKVKTAKNFVFMIICN